MQILLTNDDGIHAEGIRALERELQSLGDVSLVAPATEQSGVAHSITFLRPLVATEIFEAGRHRGWAVDGSPADCVKLGVTKFCPRRPDLVVSGINGGLNAGINVLYSGTVAAAIEGAFFGIPSVAVSLEYEALPYCNQAAKWATEIIKGLMETSGDGTRLYNLNFPTAAVTGSVAPHVRVVPMGCARYGEQFLERTDPRGRVYYWATNDPDPQGEGLDTDLTALKKGEITVTPLKFDMTFHERLATIEQTPFDLSPLGS